jgi:hypothetical protein
VNNQTIPLSGHRKTLFDIFQKGILRMNNPVSRIETLDHRIERWAVMISDCSATTVAGILLIAENVFHAVRDLGRYGPQARLRLQLKARLSQPMMAKLEAIGRHAEVFRRKAHNLPPSVSSLYALARKSPHKMASAIEMDLRGKTRSEIMELFAAPRAAKPAQRLMTISAPPGVADATKLQLIADIKAAIGRIGGERKIVLSIKARSVAKQKIARPVETRMPAIKMVAAQGGGSPGGNKPASR